MDTKIGETIFFDGERFITREEAIEVYGEEKVRAHESRPIEGKTLKECVELIDKINTRLRYFFIEPIF